MKLKDKKLEVLVLDEHIVVLGEENYWNNVLDALLQKRDIDSKAMGTYHFWLERRGFKFVTVLRKVT